MRVTTVCLVLLAGCGVVQDVIRSDKPTARVTGVGIEDFSLDGLALRFDVRIDNPYSVGLPLLSLDFALASEGRPFLAGSADAAGTIPARDARTVPVTARVRFADLLRVLSGVKPGALVPYGADFRVVVDAPGVGRLNLPLRKEGELPVPTVPDVRLEQVEWTRLEPTEARARLTLGVDNPNRFAMRIERLGFDLSLGGVKVAEGRFDTEFDLDDVAPEDAAVDGQGAWFEGVDISFSPLQLGAGVFNLLSGRAASSYVLSGTLDVKTPFGPLAMPYQSSGRVPLVSE
jgi:LEA14-like dessication related protein